MTPAQPCMMAARRAEQRRMRVVELRNTQLRHQCAGERPAH